MIKVKCDRCGKDLAEETALGTKVTLYLTKSSKDSKSKTYDLCSKCFSGLESYISKQIKSYSDFFS